MSGLNRLFVPDLGHQETLCHYIKADRHTRLCSVTAATKVGCREGRKGRWKEKSMSSSEMRGERASSLHFA